jgi:hypothetical protein
MTGAIRLEVFVLDLAVIWARVRHGGSLVETSATLRTRGCSIEAVIRVLNRV